MKRVQKVRKGVRWVRGRKKAVKKVVRRKAIKRKVKPKKIVPKKIVPPPPNLTPRQILLDHFITQVEIAKAAGTTRQAISVAFSRGRLSFQIAAVLARRMGIPVNTLLTEWVPDTNRRAKQSESAKRRMAALAALQPHIR